MGSRTRRAGVVATATTLLSAVALAGSQAGAMSAGGGVVVTVSPAGLHNVDATLSYDATPFPGGAFVEFNCKAVAWVDPASTGIDTCSINGVEAVGSPNNLPGAVSVAAGVAWVPDGTTVEACVGAHARFVEPLIGPLDVTAPVDCDDLGLLVNLASVS